MQRITIAYTESGTQLVHAADCIDVKRIRGVGYYHTTTADYVDRAEVAADIWADHLEEGSCESVEQAIRWTTFKPCVTLR